MSSRKQQVLDVAAELLQSRVFSAFSYQDIADQLSISKAAIHSHYRTKEQLGNALLDSYLDATKQVQAIADNAGSSAWQKFDAYIDTMASRTINSGQVCMASVLRLEHNVISPAMQKGVEKVYELDKDWLEKVLIQGLENGEMSFKGSARSQASLIVIAIQGALINARAEGEGAFFDTIEQIRCNMMPD
ncbi:TetR/AcrR family transcriptional regulator [Vibrio pacinii]|uniref:TetR/AcrR family transcriptional regulator n=1 Tax=Vibrio pacinii TaxID=170674 RepID=UPI00056F46A7|nr:TetR/AcrR family transcriptional regulator [Vibrio pacinii]